MQREKRRANKSARLKHIAIKKLKRFDRGEYLTSDERETKSAKFSNT